MGFRHHAELERVDNPANQIPSRTIRDQDACVACLRGPLDLGPHLPQRGRSHFRIKNRMRRELMLQRLLHQGAERSLEVGPYGPLRPERGLQGNDLLRRLQGAVHRVPRLLAQSVGRLDALAVDKAGPLTAGDFGLSLISPAPGVSEETLLATAACLEQGSEHPLAKAIVKAAQQRGLALEAVEQFSALPGQGVCGNIAGESALAGTADFLQSRKLRLAAHTHVEAATPILVARNGHHLGTLWLTDTLRSNTPQSLQALRDMGVDVVMLTGDQESVARAVAEKLGIADFHARQAPQDKAAAIKRLQDMGRKVGMAGDGINDAPALAQADASFAMGMGADIAKETADITLARHDLAGLAEAVALSRATLKKIRQNLFFAFVYNVLGIPLAALGLLSPVFAGAAMAMSSVSVVTNALLLRKRKPLADQMR